MSNGAARARRGDHARLFLFARFRALPGHEADLEAAIRDVITPTRAEADCLAIHLYRSTRDPGLFFIHSRWRSEAAFDAHARLPHTVRFVERVRTLIDHEFESHRTVQIF